MITASDLCASIVFLELLGEGAGATPPPLYRLDAHAIHVPGGEVIFNQKRSSTVIPLPLAGAHVVVCLREFSPESSKGSVLVEGRLKLPPPRGLDLVRTEMVRILYADAEL